MVNMKNVMDGTKCDVLADERVFDGSYRVLKLNSSLRNRFVKIHSFVIDSIVEQVDLIKDIDWTTAKFDELPQWLKWNEYLRQGHRPPLPSLLACLKSLFRIHTETVNIWSHLLSCVAFSLILIYNCFLSDHELREKLAFSPYIVGFVICFGLSAAYHTICCHSEPVSKAACICDYLGIVACMLGALYSAMVYLWWCRWHWTILYCAVYTGVGVVMAHLVVRTQRNDGKAIRAVMITSVGVSSLITLFHDMASSGFWYVLDHYPLGRVLVILALSLAAATLYSTRTPERFWPGKFDIWFHSHQLFHILVAAAAFIGYHALISMAHFRATTTNNAVCDEKHVLTLTKLE